MAIEVFNRYEHKYILDSETFKRASEVINRHMETDPYNKGGERYTISNLYYDTYDDRLIRTSLSSPVYKEKLRLRAYGVPDADSRVFLEIKKKFSGLVNKRRTALTLSEAYRFAETGEKPQLLPYMNEQVINEISYFLSADALMPKLYLAYDRLAFFEKNNDGLRVSFDTNIRSRRHTLRLEAGDSGEPLLEDGTWLMEVKTLTAKPLWFVHMLTELDIKRQNFSKYGTEYKKRQRSGENRLLQEYGARSRIVLRPCGA